MQKLEAMGAFVKVVSSGSYAEAARRLGLTRSAVSKAVAELERQLGARLIDRTTRRLSVTETGSTYYERCVALLAQVEEAEAEIARLHEEPRGLLRVNGPMSFGTLYLGEAIADFMTSYPDLRVELELTDRYIDPLAEGVDVTVRIGVLAESSLIARKISIVSMAMVASPRYVETYGAPTIPEDLSRHRCLHYGRHDASSSWRLPRSGHAGATSISPRLFSNNGEVLRSAALKGLGVAFLPKFLVRGDLRNGDLVEVLADFVAPPGSVYALYAPTRFVPTKIRLFVDFLAARFGERTNDATRKES